MKTSINPGLLSLEYNSCFSLCIVIRTISMPMTMHESNNCFNLCQSMFYHSIIANYTFVIYILQRHAPPWLDCVLSFVPNKVLFSISIDTELFLWKSGIGDYLSSDEEKRKSGHASQSGWHWYWQRKAPSLPINLAYLYFTPTVPISLQLANFLSPQKFAAKNADGNHLQCRSVVTQVSRVCTIAVLCVLFFINTVPGFRHTSPVQL